MAHFIKKKKKVFTIVNIITVIKRELLTTGLIPLTKYVVGVKYYKIMFFAASFSLVKITYL